MVQCFRCRAAIAGVWVPSLVGKLRSHTLHVVWQGQNEKKKKKTHKKTKQDGSKCMAAESHLKLGMGRCTHRMGGSIPTDRGCPRQSGGGPFPLLDLQAFPGIQN